MAYLCYFIQDQFLRAFPGESEDEEEVEEELEDTYSTTGSERTISSSSEGTVTMPSRRPAMGHSSSTEQLLFEDENHNETTPPSAKRVSLTVFSNNYYCTLFKNGLASLNFLT